MLLPMSKRRSFPDYPYSKVSPIPPFHPASGPSKLETARRMGGPGGQRLDLLWNYTEY